MAKKKVKRSIKKDKAVKALHAGKRVSKETGDTYYESRPNRSDKNRTKKLASGGSLQSMTTKQLAEKAGVTMEDMDRDNLHREDLIAMITQGNYKKGGKVKKDFGTVYNEVVKYIMKDQKVDRERAIEIIDEEQKEGWIRDMVEWEGETNAAFLGEQVLTTDEGKYKSKGGSIKRSIKKDKSVKALHAGKRESADGNIYYESRPNRSDKNRTKKLENGGGVGEITNDVIKSEAEWLINENWKFVLENKESHTPKRVRDLAVSDVDDYDTFRSVWKEEYNATEKDFQNLKSYIKNMSDDKILSLKKDKYAKGGGVGSEKSHEDLVNEKLDSNGEISTDDFASIIGRSPCYPVCHVGGSKYRKQFLRGCYRKMGGAV